MDEKRKKKMIGRISKGEKIIVNMMSENLMDHFDRYTQDCERQKRIIMDFCDDMSNLEKGKLAHFARFEIEKLRHEMWTAIHEQYGHWNENIGVRDGYALVSMGSPLGGLMDGAGGKQIMKSLLEFLKDAEEEQED